MTFSGGSAGRGNIFSVGIDGSGFTNMVSFTGTSGADPGANPYGGLTLVGTTLYGMTANGGSNGKGNIFSVGIDGSNFSCDQLTGSGY